MSGNSVVEAAWDAFRQKNYVQSSQLASIALRSSPSDMPAASCKILSDYWLGADVDATIRAIKKLIKRVPDFPALRMDLGSIYAFKGDLDKAKEAFECAVELAPDDASAFAELTAVKKFSEFDEMCSHMLARYDAGVDDENEKAALCFGLAKVFDDLGAYDKAIQFCLEANAARNYSYAPLRQQKHLTAVRSLAKGADFSQLADSGVTSKVPIFIVGMPRSGTSLAETILGRHAKVRACGEMLEGVQAERNLVAKHPSLRKALVPQIDVLSCVSSGELATEANNWRQAVDNKRGDKYTHFTDKMPGNAVRLGLLVKLFPNARIIHMNRNPLDCCVSNLFARFGPDHAYTTRQDWLSGYYRYTEHVVAAWKSIIDVPVLDVQYEEMVADPETQTRRILEFAGLDWDDACLDHTKGSNEVRTASMWQARQPINRKSVDRWRRYEPWIQELIEALGGYEALGVEKGNGI